MNGTTASPPAQVDIAAIVAEIDRIIADDAPHLAYDPIIHELSSTVLGYEALARFGGELPVRDWMRVAELTGRGPDLELTILRSVVERLDESDGSHYLACNLTPSIMCDPRVVQVAASTHRSEHLVIELTGPNTIFELRQLHLELEALRNARVRVGVHLSALDRTTLDYLVLEQPDIVKLDVGLTRRIASGQERFAAEFLRRCQHETIFVIAVGVETNEDLDAVTAIGIDAYQGHLSSNQ